MSAWCRRAARSIASRCSPTPPTTARRCSPSWRASTPTIPTPGPGRCRHPVTREIILGGARPLAVDAFTAFYQLEHLRRVASEKFEHVDALALPTAPTLYTVEQVLADPIQLNSRLGTYTNFVNLLDLCGLALPAAMRNDGLPSGVTLLAPGGQDAFLASMGRVFHADTAL